MATRSITSPEKTDREVTEEMTTGSIVNEVFEQVEVEEEPKLVVTVKIDVNRTEQIFIYEDDRAEDLATMFCQ